MFPTRSVRCVVTLFFLLASVGQALAQLARDSAVEVSATVQAAPPQITLSWLPSSYPIALQKIYRRLKGAPTWSDLATPATTATAYTDTAVVPGVSYEYFVYRDFSGSAPTSAAGYLNGGIALPLVESRGKVILLVDDTMAAPLATELGRWEQDLRGDGWIVLRQDIARTASVPAVKAAIVALSQLDPAQTRALILFGRIPVPYSGNLAPDGHPDHQGAWPADVFYGDVNGTWTDSSVNNNTADRPANRNVPGDGKYDQSTLPSNVELEVGRIDLSNMNVAPFGVSETELLRQYLNRNHDFRHRAGHFANVVRRGLIDDNFGYFGGEAFAASGWRNLTAFFGSTPGNVVEGDWFGTLSTSSHLWAYGCGGGSYFSAAGVGSTGDFGTTRSLAVFTMLFGSYFGDWDNNDDFLRAPLAGHADSLGLACLWAGRPHWHLHHMALGETLGYSTRLSQNNGGGFSSGYVVNNGGRLIHIALMGDPTLRMHMVAPAANLSVSGGVPVLTWTASVDPVAGYRVYRAATPAGPFQPIASATISGSSYTDRSGVPGQSYTYMLRAVTLESSASGTYWNAAHGVFTDGAVAGPVAREINVRGQAVEIPSGDTSASTANGTDFGGGPVNGSGVLHTFTIANDGTSTLSLTGSPRVQVNGPLEGDFTVETQPDATVAGASAVTFQLKFVPRAVGERAATVTILNDDPDEGSYTFVLRGTGDSFAPNIAVSPASITRALAPGGSVAVPVTIDNTGSAGLPFTLQNSQTRYGFLLSTAPGGPTYAWTDIATTGTEVTGFSNIDDAISSPIALGFSFPFYGSSFTTLRVCTNGFLSFTDTAVPFENTSLPSVGGPRNAIAACWDDMILENGARIFTQQIGGNFVVQFDSLQIFNKPAERTTCQIVLKPTGEILLLYHTVSFADHLYTIGIQNGSRTDGLEVANNTALAQPGLAVRIAPPGLESWLTLGASTGHVAAGGAQIVPATLNATGLGPGVYGATISVLSDDPDEPLVQVPVELIVLTPIQVWRQANFGTYADAGASADNADPDLDDIPNLLEYAFTLDPHANDATGLPAAPGSLADYLAIQFTRNVTHTDLTYEVQASADLAAWTAIARSTGGAATVGLGAHSVAESGVGDVRTVTVEDSTPITASAKRFLRMRIAR
jgi:hypothetical protein